MDVRSPPTSREGSEPVPPAPRVLSVDLDRAPHAGPLGAALRAWSWSSQDPALERVGSWSGLALALALLEERARAAAQFPAALVVAVGEGVSLGLPT